uniref:7TM_GPCR_Srx domain-containing protein n=1 Tax=Rhabditophanes sp. KR3021 TaxID=114890 RepID=A0AC35U9B7_9BILA
MMYPTAYDILLQILSTFAFILNVCTFFIIHLQAHKHEGAKFFVILKWGRLIESLTPFIIGPFIGAKTMYPILGAACSGICHKLNSVMVCKYGIILGLVTPFPIMTYICISYLLRYNIFVRNKPLYYANWVEKLTSTFFAIIIPITILILFKDSGISREQYLLIYANNSNILAEFDDTYHTLLGKEIASICEGSSI